MIKRHESEEQAALFEWAGYNRGAYPEFALMYHIPNGGSRNKIEAANLKRQGVKAGVPDICLPVARGKYHGLYIELKVDKNKPTQNQIEWADRLNAQGYLSLVCYGFDEARKAILKYLNLGDFRL